MGSYINQNLAQKNRIYKIYKIYKFSHDLDLLMSFIQIFWRISRAMFRLRLVMEPCSLLIPFFAPDFFFARDSLNRICFTIPTKSSSTLCWIPLEASMNLQSRASARAFPSVKKLVQNVAVAEGRNEKTFVGLWKDQSLH